MKTVGRFLVAICCVFLLWIAVSFVDVNLHNGMNPDGTPQTPTTNGWNAFVIMTLE